MYKFVDVFTPLHVYADNMLINFFIMVLGIIIFSVGTGIYAEVNLGRGSYEAVTFAFVDNNGFAVKYVRMVLDIVVVVLGVLLGGKFGLCTVATILISGPAIQMAIKIIKNLKNSSIA